MDKFEIKFIENVVCFLTWSLCFMLGQLIWVLLPQDQGDNHQRLSDDDLDSMSLPHSFSSMLIYCQFYFWVTLCKTK